MKTQKQLFMAVKFRMIRTLLLFLAFAGLSLQFPLSRVSAETIPNELLAGVHKNWPPLYSMNDETGKPTGFAIDIMDEVARRAGLKIRYVIFDEWPPIAQAMKEGRIDLIPNFGIVKERTADYDFSSPIEAFDIVIFVRKTTTDIRGITDLQGRNVAVVTENKGLSLIQEFGKAKPVIFNTLDEALLSLLSGNTDALVYPEPPVLTIARKSKLSDRIKTVGQPLLEVKRAIAVGKGRTELLHKLDAAVKELIPTQAYKKIYAKWYVASEPYWGAQRVLILAGIILALVVVIFLIWHYLSLRHLNKNLKYSLEEQKKAKEALREKTKELDSYFNNALDLFCIADMNGYFCKINKEWETTLGFKLQELEGKRFLDFVHPDDMASTLETISLLEAQKDVLNFENRYRCKDGSYRWIEWRSTSSGKLIHAAARDITERKRVDEEKRTLQGRLQRAEKMEALGQLAGGVAHDLNNVLGILSGYSELLLEEIPEGSRSKGYVEKILQSTEKGAAIIQDLLTLARRGVSVSDVINLNSVVSGFFKTPVFERMKDYHPHVTFKTEFEKNLLNIKGSPVHLEKTLMNLVSNAAEAIPGDGTVTIRTENRYLDKPIRGYDEVKQGDYVVLIVSDTGMGIPPENREKIFEPFYTKKTMGRSGTGLGLAIVWGTVKDHNGYIDLQTEVGEGTTFTLYFPVTREELIAPPQKEPIGRYMGKGESVLVVDDIAEQLDIASSLLTRLGYNVHTVASGEEAVEYLKGNHADILVLDMIMAPGIDGLETYQRVIEINPKQKAILVSGFAETDRIKEAQKLGAGAYVKKPYVREKMGVAIRDELTR